jgi:hypothetical protein
MTLDEIRNSTKEVLTPAEVAEVLGCDAQDIRLTARLHPERLGFNVAVIGTRTKIPRLGFLNWLEGRCENGNAS